VAVNADCGVCMCACP